jgi:hypothetical protein
MYTHTYTYYQVLMCGPGSVVMYLPPPGPPLATAPRWILVAHKNQQLPSPRQHQEGAIERELQEQCLLQKRLVGDCSFSLSLSLSLSLSPN